MKAKIKAHGDRHVTMVLPKGHPLNRRLWGQDVRKYYAPVFFVYKEEMRWGLKARRVCSFLKTEGTSLRLKEGDRLVDLIRHEYQAAMREARVKGDE